MEGNYFSMIARRVFLLQAISQNIEKLQSEIGQEKWASFSSGLVASLAATCDEVLRGLPHDSKLKKVVKHVFEKKDNVVLPVAQICEHYVKMKDGDGDQLAMGALVVETALAQFTQAFDKHVLGFLHENPNESNVLALVSGSDLPRKASTWTKFLDTYNPIVMPVSQQFGFLAIGLDLSNYLIHRLHAPPCPPPQLQALTTSIIELDNVFFATDRSDIPRLNSTRGVGGSVGDLNYGVVRVGIEAGGPTPTPYHEVEYISHDFMEKDYTKFIQTLNSHLALLDEEAGNSSPTADVLIFIHGFANPLGDGVRRAAQIKHDMKLFGTAIAYAWPSQGVLTLEGYLQDEKAVALTTPYLASFIKLCITQVKARRLHVLAHSMGNRAMIGALGQIYAEIVSSGDGEWIRTGLPHKNVISAAADSTMSDFQGMVEAAKQIFGEEDPGSEHRPHFSVYTSTDDRPLIASSGLHFGEGLRLGLTQAHYEDNDEPPETGFIDVIDATGHHNHMYFAEDADVLGDMEQLISVRGKERAYLRADASDGLAFISNVKHASGDKVFEFYSFSPDAWPWP